MTPLWMGWTQTQCEAARLNACEELQDGVRTLVRAIEREHPDWDAKQVRRAVRAAVTDALNESAADGNRPRHLWAAWGKVAS